MIPSVLIKGQFARPIFRNYREICDSPASEFLIEGRGHALLFDFRSRIAISSITFTNNETDGKNSKATLYIAARDAFNGLPLWKIPTISPGNGTPQEYQFIANDTRVFTFPEPGSFAVALDAATGKVVTTFDKGAKSVARNDTVHGSL